LEEFLGVLPRRDGMERRRLLPTGECWCGCGTEVRRGSFFASGHDKRAEGMLIRLRYGGVAEFLAHHGYGAGGKNLTSEFDRWTRGGEAA
jgi:hypothetical protein